MKSKYHSRKITKDGMTFDSVKEYKRWLELSRLEKAGKIKNLKCQFTYPLIPAQYEYVTDAKTGKKKRKCVERACDYIADFVYQDESGHWIVEDVKGYRKGGAYALFVVKRKLMLHVYGIKIKEV